jgi:hypothetical protein
MKEIHCKELSISYYNVTKKLTKFCIKLLQEREINRCSGLEKGNVSIIFTNEEEIGEKSSIVLTRI